MGSSCRIALLIAVALLLVSVSAEDSLEAISSSGEAEETQVDQQKPIVTLPTTTTLKPKPTNGKPHRLPTARIHSSGSSSNASTSLASLRGGAGVTSDATAGARPTHLQHPTRRPLPIVLPSGNDATKLTLQQAGLDMLRSIKGPVAPVVVIGPYRSGEGLHSCRTQVTHSCESACFNP